MLACPVCRKSYDASRHRPMVGICGHTICIECRASLITKACPVSDKCYFLPSSFILSTTNYKIMQIVEERQADIKAARIAKQERARKLRELDAHVSAEIVSDNEKIALRKRKLEEEMKLTEEGIKACEEERKREEMMKQEMQKKLDSLPKCSNCNDRMQPWLVMCCVTCSEGMGTKKGKTTIVDMEKVEKSQICGECILNSHHKKHNFAPIMKLKLSSRVEERCKVHLDQVKKLDWRSTIFKPQLINIQRQCVDAVSARSIDDCDVIIDSLIRNCEMVMTIHAEKEQALNETTKRIMDLINANISIKVEKQEEEGDSKNDSITVIQEFVATPRPKSRKRPAFADRTNTHGTKRLRSTEPGPSRRQEISDDDVIVID